MQMTRAKRQSYLVPYSVNIVFNFPPSSVTLDFRIFFTILAEYTQTWQHLCDYNCLFCSCIKQIILLRSHGRLDTI